MLLVAGPWLEERGGCMLAFGGYILFPAISVSCFACWLHEVSCLSVGIRRTQGPVLRLDIRALTKYPRMSLLKHGWPRMSRGPQNKHQRNLLHNLLTECHFCVTWSKHNFEVWVFTITFAGLSVCTFSRHVCVACAPVRMFLCPTVGSLCALESDGS